MATQQLSLQLRAERARLGGQCALILGMLQTGRRTNVDLSRHALNYRARISELRAHGHIIKVVSRNYETGLCWYGLFLNGMEVGR